MNYKMGKRESKGEWALGFMLLAVSLSPSIPLPSSLVFRPGQSALAQDLYSVAQLGRSLKLKLLCRPRAFPFQSGYRRFNICGGVILDVIQIAAS